MIRLNRISLSLHGRRVDYHYTVEGLARKFIDHERPFYVMYDRDVSSCHQSVLAVPFVTNFEPIGWLAGFDVLVPELDSTFALSREPTRAAFAEMYPGKIRQFGVRMDKSVPNHISGDKRLLLFSGGLDATATLIRHHDEPLILVTVRGADIPLDDVAQWSQCLSHISMVSHRYEHAVVTSNLREFYTAEVEARLLFGWWGRLQHGHALLGLLAPISMVTGARISYIASSYDVPMAWGSTPQTDELLAWADARCVHDAANLSRQKKAELIVSAAKSCGKPTPLRVCYSEVQRDGNCGRCEKCYRTIMNLVLSGADPRDFGLPMSPRTYPDLFNLVMRVRSSRGLIAFWDEIAIAAKQALSSGSFFVLDDEATEKKFVCRIAKGDISQALKRNLSPWRDTLAQAKFILRVRMPQVYSFLRQVAVVMRSFRKR
jgi:hypothetical protein